MNEHAVMAERRLRAGRDQVRVAYGAVPALLELFPESDPIRVRLRDSARDMLAAQGYLTVEEMATLPVQAAITTALKRLRDEPSGAE